MRSGTTIAQPESARGTIGISTRDTDGEEQETPAKMMLARAAAPGLLAGEHRDGEHAQRQGRERQAGPHGAVFEHHLQEDREGDHQHRRARSAGASAG